MEDQKISIHEAYIAMFTFLEDYYERTKADDIGALLGDLQLNENDEPFDPAAKHDWQAAVSKALQGNG